MAKGTLLTRLTCFQEQKEELQGEKFQEVQALVIEYETAEILKVSNNPQTRTLFKQKSICFLLASPAALAGSP